MRAKKAIKLLQKIRKEMNLLQQQAESKGIDDTRTTLAKLEDVTEDLIFSYKQRKYRRERKRIRQILKPSNRQWIAGESHQHLCEPYEGEPIREYAERLKVESDAAANGEYRESDDLHLSDPSH